MNKLNHKNKGLLNINPKIRTDRGHEPKKIESKRLYQSIPRFEKNTTFYYFVGALISINTTRYLLLCSIQALSEVLVFCIEALTLFGEVLNQKLSSIKDFGNPPGLEISNMSPKTSISTFALMSKYHVGKRHL
jgi:hypothetical protein